MPSHADRPANPVFVAIGDNDARMFSMDTRERAERLAGNAKLEVARAVERGRAALLGNLQFAWDPAWLGEVARRPGSALMVEGRPVLVNVPASDDPAPVAAAMTGDAAFQPDGYQLLDPQTAELSTMALRKRERPFAMPLSSATAAQAERAAYDASYKGVTDVLTLYLWRRPAFHLVRWAAGAGISPNMVTLVGFLLCVAAFWLFWVGQYWAGFAAGFAFMVLDTVDGKLARCTGSSSKWGDIFDHGVDLIHPPFWWWAWAHGLDGVGLALEPVYKSMVVGAIVSGYIAGRLIEGLFVKKHGIEIHIWRPIDSKFRLITARRNPNMLILFVSLLAGRPDVGIELVALWTLLSLIFHAVRLAQANARADRGRKIISWLS
ncbi:CDP-alcohol phosphatidyltransferase family protein [Sphingomonas sp. GCM10030256]|uniref:CDP-alcohol phosphatidyltransferase family protein n=1 Tax=Sphingomonas sp. GCM10030256 TaxID=3273427 RepID=UPI00362458DB